MLRTRPYSESDRKEWDRFVDSHPDAHPGQLIAWRELTSATYGCQPEYWLAEDAAGICAVLPVFQKRRLGRIRSLFSAPGGLLARSDEAALPLLQELHNWVARDGLAYAELRDQLHLWPGLATSDEHCTHRLQLAPSADEQWKRFDAKLRNQIRKAQKSDLVVRIGHAQVGAFYRVMLENMRDLGTPMRGLWYFQCALQYLGERAEILVVEHAGEPIGAMFLAFHGNCVFDLWASSLRREFSRCPNQMLYWEALQLAIRRGKGSFDFGRSQWGSPTFRFKEQWGAQAIPLGYQYVLGAASAMPSLAGQRGKLDLASRIWQSLPLALAARLGEPVRRLFPELM